MGTMNLVGTARCAVRAAFSGATVPPSIARAGTSQRDVPTRVWFMERLAESRVRRKPPSGTGESGQPDFPLRV